jgi:hypothetical protein
VKERFAMENPILDFTDTLAKYSDEGEFRARIAATINAARMSWARLDVAASCGDDDDVEPAPAPRRPHRTRTPSLTKALREAKKAGIPVTGATFTAGSVSLSFGEAAKSNGNDLDQWLAGRHENPTQRN